MIGKKMHETLLTNKITFMLFKILLLVLLKFVKIAQKFAEFLNY